MRLPEKGREIKSNDGVAFLRNGGRVRNVETSYVGVGTRGKRREEMTSKKKTKKKKKKKKTKKNKAAAAAERLEQV